MSELLSRQKLLFIDTNCSIRDATNKLIDRGFQQVLVVSPTNPERLVGLLTLNEISRQQNALDEVL